MRNTQTFRDNMYTKQQRIVKAAEKHAGKNLVSVAHNIDAQWMYCAYEDKILQRAIVMVLEPILEKEFYDFSYGFSPGKSAHKALERIWKESLSMNGG